jgi:cbb3-type cytochrome oxidase subunit 3
MEGLIMTAIYNIGLLTITLLVAYVIIWAFRKAWNDRKQEISNRERVRNNRQSMRPGKYY